MSPRAACRLETLAFKDVYDYVPGKSDWLARGLPTEGEKAGEPRVHTLARKDVATCALDTAIGDVIDAIEASPYGFGLVVGAEETLFGRLRLSKLRDVEPDTRTEELMDSGPSTVRADLSVGELRGRLDRRDLKTAIVTTPEGKLIGAVTRESLGRQ